MKRSLQGMHGWKCANGPYHFANSIQFKNSVSKLAEVQLPGEFHCWWTISPLGHMKPTSTVDPG